MINNRYMTNEELVEKLIRRIMQLKLQNSVDQRDLDRFDAIKEEILSRMNDEYIVETMIKECPCGCVSDIEDEYVLFCEQCGEELVEQKD